MTATVIQYLFIVCALVAVIGMALTTTVRHRELLTDLGIIMVMVSVLAGGILLQSSAVADLVAESAATSPLMYAAVSALAITGVMFAVGFIVSVHTGGWYWAWQKQGVTLVKMAAALAVILAVNGARLFLA